MDYNPNKVIKMVQNGKRDAVLNSSAIWLCLSCETCVTRCPNEVDIARMMDVLRQMAIEAQVAASEKNVLKFHESFLSNIKMFGRINEPLLMVQYKIKSGDFFSDMQLGAQMFAKGKLSLLSPRTNDMKSVKDIFEKGRA
jgi:heterodisulfide reductase subunit C